MMEDEKLIWKLYSRFYVFCMKIGVIKLRSHTEHQEDMVIMVLEPRWFWQR